MKRKTFKYLDKKFKKLLVKQRLEDLIFYLYSSESVSVKQYYKCLKLIEKIREVLK